MRVPWTARRSNPSILKEISPEYSLESLMLKLKLQYFGCKELQIPDAPIPDAPIPDAAIPDAAIPDAKSQLIGKDPDAGKD